MSESKQPIERKKVFGGYQYSRAGKKLNMIQLPAILSNNEATSSKIKKVTPMLIISLLIGFVGSFIIAFNISFGMFNGINWSGILVGVVMAAIGVLLYLRPYKQLDQLVDDYNASL